METLRGVVLWHAGSVAWTDAYDERDRTDEGILQKVYGTLYDSTVYDVWTSSGGRFQDDLLPTDAEVIERYRTEYEAEYEALEAEDQFWKQRDEEQYSEW